MKIAFVYDGIYPYTIGGVQKRIWELATRLAQRGHEVTIFGMKHWEGEDITYKEGVRLWGVCPPQRLFVNSRRSIKEALYFAYKLLPPLLKERFDVIDAANFPYFPCFPAKLASVTKRSQLVITWHEVWGNYWYEYLGKKGFLGKVVERTVARLNDKVVANSEATKKGLKTIGVRKEISVIPNGVDVQKAEKIVRSNEGSDVIYVGRLSKEKNVHLLIKATGYVKREIPGIRCTIIGDGPEKENLQRLISQLNLRDNTCLKEVVESEEQVFSWMKASKVFVLASVREGFGIAILEANACGVPAITVNHSQNAACDLIIDGENGFVCEVSESDIADRILRVMNSEQGWERKCLEFAKRYDWSGIVDSLERVYEAG